ncbi:MAG: AAA family ATPase, partial [Deltaproteobacteria bacterium]|nr:AAA family ATPase [Deltaproteobacteria bacterium]
VSEIDPKIGLLALLLDVADPAQLPRTLLPVTFNGLAPLTVALLAERSSQVIQSALRAGADDVLPLPPNHEDALRVLLRASEARRRAATPDHRRICSLVSMSGGRGISSLAVCLGFAIMRILEKRAVLVDLDLQAAPLSVLLDVEPEHSIADLADPTSPIDSIRLESVLTKDHAGPSLLAAPKRIEHAELVSATTVEAALKVLHDLFDVVLVDCGSHLNESSVVVFEQSDYLLYVLDQSIIAVRAAQRFLNLYASLELRTRQPQIIVNRYRPNDVITLEAIETALHLPIFATIPNDDAAFKDMQTMGRDLWSISAGVNARRSFENLARKLFAPPTQEIMKSGLFSRLLAGLAKSRGVEHGTNR